MEIERRAETRRANCGEAGCDWLTPRPRPFRLDMGIYWRQAQQSAPHLINEPEPCVDQEFHTSVLYLCYQLIEFATGIRRNRLCYFIFFFFYVKYAAKKTLLKR